MDRKNPRMNGSLGETVLLVLAVGGIAWGVHQQRWATPPPQDQTDHDVFRGPERGRGQLENGWKAIDAAIRKAAKAEAERAVAVEHTASQGNGWAVAETANFRIYHATTEEEAEKVARAAESTRTVMARKWFGEAPNDWSPVCVIYLHPTGQGYARATGAPATAPGHSKYKQEGERVLERRIDLPADNPNMLTAVLPHEVTHIILVGQFGRHYVPRWADEGMAVLSEPREQINLHLRNLLRHLSHATLCSVRELMGQIDYPTEPLRIGPFYAQSVSLVDFLCKKKSAATFARFLREALDTSYRRAVQHSRDGQADSRNLARLLAEELDKGGYERALQHHYGYRNFAELQNDWKRHVFDSGVASMSGR